MAPVDPLDVLFAADEPAAPSGVQTGGGGGGGSDVLEDIFGDGAAASSGGGLTDFAPVVEQRIFAPEMITTPQFGAKWKVTRQEVKKTVSPTWCGSPAAYSSAMESMHLHPVQTIGKEVICAGRYVADNSLVLVHGKLKPGAVDVTVRAASREIAQHIVKVLSSTLA